MNQNTILNEEIFDGREIPCSVKHGLILTRCAELKPGSSFILVNGHDPKPLRYQLEAEFPGAFRWEYVDHAPEAVRVRITRIAAATAG